MCNRIVRDAVERAVGYFRKGNEPASMRMEILVAGCECGDRFYAKTPNGTVWVEAEKEERRDVDGIDVSVFVQDVENC